jgi:hypothetical protein
MTSVNGLLKRFVLLFCLAAGLTLAVSAQPEAGTATGPSPSVRALADDELKLTRAKNESDRFYITTQLAPRAFTAGDMAKAGGYAEVLLKQAESMKENWNYGNAVHAAHLVLGRIALASGDSKEAISHLLAAGRTPGSPQLNSFGPDMLFASELLAKGERKTVLEYFDLCTRFWKHDNQKLAEWRAAVEKGEAPNFGPNLRYFF